MTLSKELKKVIRKVTNSHIDENGNVHCVLTPADAIALCQTSELLERRERDKQESLLKCSTRTCAAPPAPIVPTFEVWCQRVEQNPVGWVREAMKEAYEGCRAAMHGSTISNSDDFAIDELPLSFGNSEKLNSPVIPDGWQLVPIEPTEDMIIQGFESEPDEFFSKDEDWEAYQDMSGCEQAAHRAKLCWAAMLAAAPKQQSE